MKNIFLRSVLTLSFAIVSSSAIAGGGGSGWTQCYAKELGYSYYFNGYVQSLEVGEYLTVSTVSEADKKYSRYKVDFIDLSQDIGIVELSHAADDKNSSKDSDFGKMKIEYLSNSALSDIRVTFSKIGVNESSSVKCLTD